jgi:hypothetical protein
MLAMALDFARQAQLEAERVTGTVRAR